MGRHEWPLESRFEYTTIDPVDNPTIDVVGDATERQVLREAGIADAGTVVPALPKIRRPSPPRSPFAN